MKSKARRQLSPPKAPKSNRPDIVVRLPRDVEGPCPVREILDQVGDKWTALVISNLAAGPLRFSEIKRRVRGISQRMLTATVRGLERNGALLRTVYPTIPPRVDYSLTPLGFSMLVPVQALVGWALDHRAEITEAQLHFDREQAKPVEPFAQVRRKIG